MLLPRPFPDEPVGLFLYRMERQLGIGREGLLRRLTGRNLANHSPLMTCYPDVARAVGMPFVDLLQNHTVLPYVLAFSGKDCSDWLRDFWSTRRQGPLATASMVASAIVGEKWLRLCPACVEFDLRKYGESFWHRSHQLSAVRFCPEHRTALVETDIPIGRAARSVPTPDQVVDFYPCSTVELAPEVHMAIARLTLSLLRGEVGLGVPTQWFLSTAIDLGYVYIGGKAHSTLLAEDLGRFFGPEFLERYQCIVSTHRLHRWPAKLLQPSAHRATTLRHVLLHVFLSSRPRPSTTRIQYERRNQPKPRDWAAFQTQALEVLEAAVNQHKLAGTRVNLEQLYNLSGIRSVVRTKPERIPRLMAWIKAFKHSSQSTRIPGRRPRK